MKNMFLITLFMLATLAWTAAQQRGSDPAQSGQTTSPSSQAPSASQTQPSTPDQADSRGRASNAPVTEGCLGGNDPNYTITDKAGTTYKLTMPSNSDASSLTSHVGESVQVQGDVKSTSKEGASIDVQRIGKGQGTCPASKQSPPKQ